MTKQRNEWQEKGFIHGLLNEPEFIKIIDYVEAILYLVFALGMTTAYLMERMGKTGVGVISVFTAVISGGVLGILYVVRRPINRRNRGGDCIE